MSEPISAAEKYLERFRDEEAYSSWWNIDLPTINIFRALLTQSKSLQKRNQILREGLEKIKDTSETVFATLECCEECGQRIDADEIATAALKAEREVRE